MNKRLVVPSAVLLSSLVFSPTIVTFTAVNTAFAQATTIASKLPMTAGVTLNPETRYPSPSVTYYLILQSDGNLIVKSRNGQYFWGLDQVVRKLARNSRVEIKPNGTFGVYDDKGNAVWQAPGKREPGASLALTDEGVLRLVSRTNEILWASNGIIGPMIKEVTSLPMPAGTTLKKGTKYFAGSGNYYLIFAEDGNLMVRYKDDSYIWGLDRVARNLSRTSRVEIKPDGSFGVYDAKGSAIWSAPGKRSPGASLTLSHDGALQLVSRTNEILWASNGVTSPSIKVVLNKANLKPCTEPGWDACVEMADPKMKIITTKAVSPAAINAVANIYTEMIKRLNPSYPKSTFNGFKVYIDNGESWSVLSKLKPIGTMWPAQTGPKSGNFLRGGASSDNYLWITEQMIAKRGVKTRNADGTPDNVLRTFDQVVHEFAHIIDMKFIPDQTVNKFNGNGTPVESFALRVQQWFGAPGDQIPPAQEAELSKIFTSRVSFSTEGYRQ